MIFGYVKGLRLRSSKRLTVNVIRNQQRNRITLDETNIASSQLMEYDFSPLVGLPVPGRGGKASLVNGTNK